MALIALSTFKTRVRRRADMIYSQYISDAELVEYINGSLQELYDLFVEANLDYFTATTTFTVASGSSSQPLPTNAVYKLRGLDINIAGSWIPVPAYEQMERGRLLDGRNNRLCPTVSYRVFGETIEFLPTDQAPGDYRLRYVPVMTPLVADSDTFNGYNGLEEYAVVDAAIKCKDKEESSVTVLMAQKDKLEKRVQAMANVRDYASVERVSDVRTSTSGVECLFGL